ncbi:Hypothetical protein BSM4216_1189 [Bacillus smithii]|jgi:hypothetical protein|nr:Hypothetical protein BSM4216_1189 [Bacillus smithii]
MAKYSKTWRKSFLSRELLDTKGKRNNTKIASTFVRNISTTRILLTNTQSNRVS